MRLLSRALLTSALLFLVWLIGCTNQSAPTTLLPSGTQPSGSQPTPSVTPVVLRPGTPAAPFTPVASVNASGVSLIPTPLASLAAPANLSVPILMYHQIKDLPANANVEDLTWTVSPASFAAQLHYLADNGYTTITLDQLLDGYAGKASLPSKPVVLTFDDWSQFQFFWLPKG